MKTRREFLKTVAAGSAVAIAAVATQSAAATVVKAVATSAKRPDPKSAPSKGAASARAANAHRMDPAELAKQRKYTADALKVIRDYVLPAGSPMAFSFKPLKAARSRGSR